MRVCPCYITVSFDAAAVGLCYQKCIPLSHAALSLCPFYALTLAATLWIKLSTNVFLENAIFYVSDR